MQKLYNHVKICSSKELLLKTNIKCATSTLGLLSHWVHSFTIGRIKAVLMSLFGGTNSTTNFIPRIKILEFGWQMEAQMGMEATECFKNFKTKK